MKLFKHSNGMIVAFGFDMIARRESPRMISWSDFGGESWEALATNCAGATSLSFQVAPEFVRECGDRIVAYQPGKCVEMTFVGPPYVWSIRTLQSDLNDLALVA